MSLRMSLTNLLIEPRSSRGNARPRLAIADFTKSIVLDPEKETFAYGYRGFAKEQIGDLTGACADWKKSAEFGHEDAFYAVDECN